MISIEKIKLKDEVYRYILKNSYSFEVHLLNYGASINKILVEGKNITLSYDDYTKYIDNGSYAGNIIGPTSGRIEDGKYVLNDKEYFLGINNGTNANHGGDYGLSNKVFDSSIIENGVVFTYRHKYLHDDVEFTIKYTIDEKNTLRLELMATSDKEAYVNLTNHTYFNLSGTLKESAIDQYLFIEADNYCPVKENMIPTGKLKSVNESSFDFRSDRKIRDNILKNDKQFEITRAIDHAFVLNKDKKLKARLYSKSSGIGLNLYTNQNVLVVYTGNYLDDVKAFDGTLKNDRYIGIALEAQNYQNGINTKGFDYDIVSKEKPYFKEIIYEFYNKK